MIQTKLNLDGDGNGCPNSGKDSQQRAFCCPPWSAPDPASCHWTDKCGAECETGEVIKELVHDHTMQSSLLTCLCFPQVTLALDDYGGGGHCNVNKKQFCCPASAVEKAVKECEWKKGDKCTGDKPQKLTYSGVSSLCCPDKPKFKGCQWQGTPGFCNQANCPVVSFEFSDLLNLSSVGY